MIPEHQHDDGREHAGDDDEHLLDVGPRDRLHAADARVEDHRHADDEHRDRQLPTENRRHDHGRRGERHAERKRATHEEEEARERAHAHVEPALEVLIRRVDSSRGERTARRHRQDDHRERQTEVELDEPQSGEIGLPRRADQRHRAHLRRHHRKAGDPPGQRSVAEKIAFDLVGALRAAQAVDNNPGDVREDDRPNRGRACLREQPPEDDEGDDDGGFEEDDANVGAGHSDEV